MDFLQLRNYAFLSQASYRGFETLQRGASPDATELRLTDAGQSALSPSNRFAVEQAKLLTGSNTQIESSDGLTFIGRRPNTATGFSGTVLQLAG